LKLQSKIKPDWFLKLRLAGLERKDRGSILKSPVNENEKLSVFSRFRGEYRMDRQYGR